MLRMCFITFCPLNFIIFRPIGSFRLLPKTRWNVKGKKAFWILLPIYCGMGKRKKPS